MLPLGENKVPAAHPAPSGSVSQKPPGARLARGFLPASTGRSAWTTMRVVRSRESLFGLRVAVGVHKQGCVWAARQSNAQRVQGVGERKKPDSARARDTGKGYSTIAWSSRCCEAPVCAVGMVQHRPAGCAGARLVVQVQRLKEGADVDPTWTNKRYAAPLLQVRTTHRSSSIAPPSCLTSRAMLPSALKANRSSRCLRAADFIPVRGIPRRNPYGSSEDPSA